MLKEMDNYLNNLYGPGYIYYVFFFWMLIFIIVKMFIDKVCLPLVVAIFKL
jgi:hypothetical protein